MLENVRIVLIGTTHPGNIGSAARAMKTMGISDLALVAPQCEVDGKTVALSAGAVDVLSGISIFDTLEEAVTGCGLVIGASARARTLDRPMLDPREMGEKVIAESSNHKVALIFGRESSGLTNDELKRCQFHVFIPANPDYSSLNLAMAVQTLSYEIRMAFLAGEDKVTTEKREYPPAQDMEKFYVHLEEALNESGFIVPQHPGQVMNKLRRMFDRTRPEVPELNILRGILSSIQKTARANNKPD